VQLILGFLLCGLACRGPAQHVDSPSTGETGAAGEGEGEGETSQPDSCDSNEALAAPWDAPGFWTDPGPLAPLFGAEPDTSDKDMMYLLFIATSDDGVTWVPDPEPIMEGINSLDLWVTDQGVILQGLIQAGRGVLMDPGTVYGIQSQDLLTWGSHAWPVEDLDTVNNLVDPSLTVRPDGTPSLVYYRSRFSDDDPIDVEGPHQIWRAIWDGQRWVNESKAVEEEGLADPVICTLDGQEWLFVNQSGGQVLGAEEDGSGSFNMDPDIVWTRHSVPFCTPDGDHLTLVSQAFGTRETPRLGRFDAAGLTDEGGLYDAHLWPYGNCTSPVMAAFQGRWVTFCSVSWQAYLESLVGDTGGAAADTGGAAADTGADTG